MQKLCLMLWMVSRLDGSHLENNVDFSVGMCCPSWQWDLLSCWKYQLRIKLPAGCILMSIWYSACGWCFCSLSLCPLVKPQIVPASLHVPCAVDILVVSSTARVCKAHTSVKTRNKEPLPWQSSNASLQYLHSTDHTPAWGVCTAGLCCLLSANRLKQAQAGIGGQQLAQKGPLCKKSNYQRWSFTMLIKWKIISIYLLARGVGGIRLTCYIYSDAGCRAYNLLLGILHNMLVM